ncbi:MAG: YfhO family protein, partial [Candidatus Hydrogenedens sp.]|nr:YfhO family protein [Candidatus Hydrogenedens sp.]
PPAEAAFERLKDPSFNPADTVILEWAPAGGAPAPFPEIPGTVTVTDYGCNHVRLEADARAEAMLVLADAYFPGWEARVNGERAEVIPAYHCFRAVKVPAGKSGVVFEYRPKSLRFGLAVSAAALLLCGAWALRELRRRRRATP